MIDNDFRKTIKEEKLMGIWKKYESQILQSNNVF